MKKIAINTLSGCFCLVLLFQYSEVAAQEEVQKPAEEQTEQATEEKSDQKEDKKKQKVKTAEQKSVVLSSGSSSSGNNPQIQNKSGADIMPVKGEFAIGMSANPFFQFAGNMFGFTGSNNSLGLSKFIQGSQLFAKYMISDNNAVRLRFRGFSFNEFYTNEVYDDLSNIAEAKVEDKYSSERGGLDLVAGYEWRRGKSRFRVVYGAEVGYSYNMGFRETYSYGNDYSASNLAPTSTVSWNSSTTNNGIPDAERIVTRKGNASNSFGLRGFAGVEYYLLPKLCIGSEFGWGGSYILRGDRVDTYERYEVVRNEITQRELKSNGANELFIDTDNLNGAIYLLFYF